MAASVMNYHGSSLRLTGGITKSRTKTVSRMDVANPKKLKNVRKMLFGPVDREEAKRIVETQMKKHVLDATSRWGFDFTADQPVRSPEAKYIWERVPPLDDAEPQMGSSNSSSGPVPVMTLSSAAHIRTIEVVALSPSSTSSTLSSANSSLVSSPSTSLCNSDLETDMDVSAVVNGDLNSNDGGAAAKRMVQKKMTDFMKEKKRTNPVLATAAKKRDFAGISTASGASSAATGADVSSSLWGTEMPPAKRMRTGSAASTSSVGSA